MIELHFRFLKGFKNNLFSFVFFVKHKQLGYLINKLTIYVQFYNRQTKSISLFEKSIKCF